MPGVFALMSNLLTILIKHEGDGNERGDRVYSRAVSLVGIVPGLTTPDCIGLALFEGVDTVVAPHAEVFVARIAQRKTLDPSTYDDIAEVRLSLHASRLMKRADILYRPSITQSHIGK